MDSKKQIRAAVRQHITGDVPAGNIWDKIEAISEFKDSDIVLVYWSLPDEIPTHEFLCRWYGKKKIALPKVVGDSLELRLYSPDTMKAGYRDILEPSEAATKVDPADIDFAVIPGVAFDRRGMRLGRGKGYYDRLIPSLKCLKVGVARDYQLFDEIPADPWDVPVDIVVTPDKSLF